MDIYDYSELAQKALAPDATQEDINNLGEWFSRYGMDCWNGEYYSVDRGCSLYPVMQEVGYDDYKVIGYTFSRSQDDRFIMRPLSDEERAAEEARETAEWARCQKERCHQVKSKGLFV